MVTKGQLLEKLVEHLEKMDMEGAEIKTRDKIYDKVAKEPREVDVSVRFEKGSHNFLIIFECRDRKRKNGPDWIEQITQKTRDIGANKVIAVSSSGFTKSAIKKAQHNNINLRTLEEITPQEIFDWFIPKSIPVRQLRYDVKQLQFIEKEFKPETLANLTTFFNTLGEKQIQNHKFILQKGVQEPGSIKDLFSTIKWDTFFTDIKYSGKKVFKKIKVYPENREAGFQLLIDDEQISIDHIVVTVGLWIEETEIDIHSIKDYKVDEKTLSQIIKFEDIDFPDGKRSMELLLTPHKEGNRVSLRFVESDKK